MSRYAVIDNVTNIIVNIIMYDEQHEYYDKTIYLVQTDSANIGDIYDKLSQSFSSPVIERNIEEVKASLITNLANTLTVHENAGVYYGENRFPTDSNSQIKYLAILLTATLDPTFITVFKSMDGVYVNLTSQEIFQLTNTIREYIKNCYIHDDYLTSTIKNATTLEELDAIDVNLGWPSDGGNNILNKNIII
jgi:hypothetical protein